MKIILSKRLWPRLLFGVVIPLTIFILTYTQQKNIKTILLSNQKQMLCQASGRIEDLTASLQKNFRWLIPILERFYPDFSQQQFALMEMSLKNPALEQIALVNTMGEDVITTNLGAPLQDRVQESAFVQAKGGDFYTSNIYLKNGYHPMVIWAAPVKNGGETVGVVMANVDLSEIKPIIESVKISKNSRIYLMDREGEVLFSTDKDNVLEDNPPLLSKEAVETMFSGETDSWETADKEGCRWLTAYAALKEMNLGLVMFESQDNYPFLQTMRIQAGIFIVLSLLTGIFIGRRKIPQT